MITTVDRGDQLVEEPAHRWLGFVPTGRPRVHITACSCGWRSSPCSSAGLAGAALDLHREGATS